MAPNSSDVTFHISAGSVIKTVLILVLFVILYYLRDIVLSLLAAVVLASSLEPFTSWLVRRRIPRPISAIVVYAILFIMVIGAFYLLLPPFLADISSVMGKLPDSIAVTYLEEGADFFGFRTALESIASGQSISDIVSNLSNALSTLSGTFVTTAIGVFGGIISFILVIVLSFYLSAQEAGVEKFLRLVVPVKNEAYIIDLWKRSQAKIGLWMQGQLVLGILVGVLVYLGLTILGVRNALLLAVLSGIFEVIPVFGPILSAIPGVAIAYLDGGIGLVLFVAGLYIIIQQFENHLIYPLVVKKVVGVHPIIVIIALLAGFKLAGLLGALLSVPAAAVIMEYLGDVERDRALHRTES